MNNRLFLTLTAEASGYSDQTRMEAGELVQDRAIVTLALISFFTQAPTQRFEATELTLTWVLTSSDEEKEPLSGTEAVELFLGTNIPELANETAGKIVGAANKAGINMVTGGLMEFLASFEDDDSSVDLKEASERLREQIAEMQDKVVEEVVVED